MKKLLLLLLLGGCVSQNKHVIYDISPQSDSLYWYTKHNLYLTNEICCDRNVMKVKIGPGGIK